MIAAEVTVRPSGQGDRYRYDEHDKRSGTQRECVGRRNLWIAIMSLEMLVYER